MNRSKTVKRMNAFPTVTPLTEFTLMMKLRGCRKRYSHISDQSQVNMRLVNLKRMLHQILSPVNKAHHQKCLRRTSTTPLSRYRQTDPRMSAAG